MPKTLSASIPQDQSVSAREFLQNHIKQAAQQAAQSRLSSKQLREALTGRLISQQCFAGKCFLWYARIEDDGNGGYRWDKTIVDEGLAQLVVPLEVPPHSNYNHIFWCHWHTDDRERIGRWSTDYLRRNVPFYEQSFRCYNKNGECQTLYEAVTLHQLAPGSWLAMGLCQNITE